MIVIDKIKCLKKWGPVIESLKIEEVEPLLKRKVELLSIYGEYKNLTHSIPNSNNLLPMELKILSGVKLENKAFIMSDYNDDKIKFINPHPALRFKLSYEEIDTDIKLARKNKINAINGNRSVSNSMTILHRLDSMVVALVISDINERLKNGQILYIDQQIISKLEIINSKPVTMEITVTYDVI